MEVTIVNEHENWKTALFFHRAAITCFIYERAPWSPTGFHLTGTVVRFIGYGQDYSDVLAQVVEEVEKRTGLVLGTIDREEEKLEREQTLQSKQNEGRDPTTVQSSVA